MVKSKNAATDTVENERTCAKHPGKILLDNFMSPLGLNANQLSRLLCLRRGRIHEIINCQRAVTAETALRLARFFGTTARFWVDLQAEYELAEAQDKYMEAINRAIEPIGVSAVKQLLEQKRAARGEKSRLQEKHGSWSDKCESANKRLRKEKGLPEEKALQAERTDREQKMTGEQQKVYKCLSDGMVHFDILIQKTGFHAAKLSAELTMLELDKCVIRHFGDYYSRA